MESSDLDHYSRMLKAGESFKKQRLESLTEARDITLSSRFSKEYEEQGRTDLRRIVSEYLENDKRLLRIADEIISQGKRLNEVLNGSSNNVDRNSVLETIVRTDGSRPSFVIQNDSIDFKSSPVGIWRDFLLAAQDELRTAIQSVGRINLPGTGQSFQGTGFLIQDNLIMTNRHVLQAVATIKNKKWEFFDNAHIDFGHEFRARASVAPRMLRKVIFAAKNEIFRNAIDHRKTDLVLIELEPLAPDSKVSRLAVDVAPDWADPTLITVVIGYPGNPGLSFATPLNLLEQLFQSMFGYKRIAPGEIINSAPNLPLSTTSYDNTTLGGNSGSCVIVLSRSQAAAGLHYGGTPDNPRSNWGHVIGRLLDAKDDFSQLTLGECLEHYKVTTINRP